MFQLRVPVDVADEARRGSFRGGDNVRSVRDRKSDVGEAPAGHVRPTSGHRATVERYSIDVRCIRHHSYVVTEFY